MIVTCSACGYESPASARFCRQCGVQLSAAFDVTEATTRNFGRQEAPPVMTKESAPLPPHIGDAMAGNTARYQSAVGGADYRPPVHFPSVANTSSLKSPRRLLKWGGFVLALFISGGMGAALNEAANKGRIRINEREQGVLQQYRDEQKLVGKIGEAVDDQRERATDELENRLDEVDRAIGEAKRAGKRPVILTAESQLLDLNPLKYPGSGTNQEYRSIGREMLQQQTADEFDVVANFYQQKMGNPIAQFNERNLRRSVFQSADKPDITVMLSQRNRRPLEITILRSPFPLSLFQSPAQKKTETPQKTETAPAENADSAARKATP